MASRCSKTILVTRGMEEQFRYVCSSSTPSDYRSDERSGFSFSNGGNEDVPLRIPFS